MSASDLPRRQIAITKASVTSSAVMVALIDQPTTRRENSSNIEPAFGRPDIGEVGDPTAIGRRRVEAALQHIRGDGARLPLT